MIPTKKQMRIISKHFKEDVSMLIKTAESVGILDPCLFLQRAVDAGLNTEGAKAMMLMKWSNPNGVVDAYSRIVSSSESISQMRGTKNWKGIVFDTDRVKRELGKLLQRDQNAHGSKKNKRRIHETI